ncbi:iron-sulfur cluster assembly accessory protein [Caldibacillus lycopersici]|uniref:Iron-sulfur cluster assembly accessory protein n=1 Tax=Perspicuibacillus lycopersici TaxID=1325689 RepID=A0AAE3ITZ7_9BACI|nr:iron-sulfur cluster assembly accessory protein [Perspicuibacillus lycopersici]MCU9613563.1 iron-sulfur cluster assembly accessory protein [Perspicuibacillus lycopersici]
MKCKINKNAAKQLQKQLELEENKGKMVRVVVSHLHGDHAHYDYTFDVPNEHDEIVKTDKGIDVLLDSRNEWLDGVWIQFFYVPQEEFVITNPTKGHQHRHVH